jgi:hypothetical protein
MSPNVILLVSQKPCIFLFLLHNAEVLLDCLMSVVPLVNVGRHDSQQLHGE